MADKNEMPSAKTMTISGVPGDVAVMGHQPVRRTPFRSNFSSIPAPSRRKARFLPGGDANFLGDGCAALR
jgi:hypothetical protein